MNLINGTMNQKEKEKAFEEKLVKIFGKEDAEQILIATMPTVGHNIVEAHQIQMLEIVVEKCIELYEK